MSRNILETIMGAVVLLVAAGFLIFAFERADVAPTSGYSVSADFDNASGIGPGSEVRLAGVKVGTVASQEIDTETFLATVTMTIREGIALPEDSSARIVPDGLLGGMYIEIEPGGSYDYLQAGDSIEFTQGTINVVDLLGRFIFATAEQASSNEDSGQQ